MAHSVIKKELSAYIYRQYPGTCPNNKTESTKFFLFAVVFLQPLCSLSLSFSFPVRFFFSPSFLHLYSYYILWLFFTISSIHVWIKWWTSFFSASPAFLESSILSCKAACSLFRHHLHINAARGLAG